MICGVSSWKPYLFDFAFQTYVLNVVCLLIHSLLTYAWLIKGFLAHGAEKVCDPTADERAKVFTAVDYDAIINAASGEGGEGEWGEGDDGWGADAERQQKLKEAEAEAKERQRHVQARKDAGLSERPKLVLRRPGTGPPNPIKSPPSSSLLDEPSCVTCKGSRGYCRRRGFAGHLPLQSAAGVAKSAGNAAAAHPDLDPVAQQVGLALEWVVKSVEREGAREWLMKQSSSSQLSAEQKESQFRDSWKQLVLACARSQRRKETNIQEVYVSNSSVTQQLSALGHGAAEIRELTLRTTELGVLGTAGRARVSLLTNRAMKSSSIGGKAGPKAALRSIDLVYGTPGANPLLPVLASPKKDAGTLQCLRCGQPGQSGSTDHGTHCRTPRCQPGHMY